MKFLLVVHGVMAHAEDGHAFVGQGSKGIAQAAGLFGATWGIGLGIEVNDDWAFFVGIAEFDRLSVLVGGGDIGCLRSQFDGIGIGGGEEEGHRHTGDQNNGQQNFHKQGSLNDEPR